jgi:hypothetical protein
MLPVYSEPETDAAASPGGEPRDERPLLRLLPVTSRVVIGDQDGARRAALLDQLTQAMPESTTFLEASTVAELFDHARGSRMVILGGALEQIPTSSLMRLLAARHPGVHVVNLQTTVDTRI